jgi:hypothetical protein
LRYSVSQGPAGENDIKEATYFHSSRPPFEGTSATIVEGERDESLEGVVVVGTFFKRSSAWAPLDLSGIPSATALGKLFGERVLPGPAGTYITIHSGSFTYRKKPLPGSPVAPQIAYPPSTGEVEGEIKTASVSELQEISGSECVLEVEKKIKAWRAVPILAWCLLPLFFLSMGVFSRAEAHLLVFGTVAVLGFSLAARFDRSRAPYLFYDLDSPELLGRYVGVSAIGAALRSSQRLWHITSSSRTADYKYNAGATSLIKRTSIGCRPGTLGRLRLNIEPWSIPVGPQQLLFLPDQLLVLEDSRLAGVPYDELSATTEVTRFIETEGQPGDARQVGSTWRYANKDGSRDRRFNNNVEIPIMEYGEIQLRSKSGVNIVVQVSSPAAATAAARAVNSLRGNIAPSPASKFVSAVQAGFSAATALVSRTPAASPTPPGDPSKAHSILSVQDILGNTLTISRDRDLTSVLVKAKNRRSVPIGPTLDRFKTAQLKTLLEEAWAKRVHKEPVGYQPRQIGKVEFRGTLATVDVNGSSVFLTTAGLKHAAKIFHHR